MDLFTHSLRFDTFSVEDRALRTSKGREAWQLLWAGRPGNKKKVVFFEKKKFPRRIYSFLFLTDLRPDSKSDHENG